jgi:hypothetical protein
MPSHGADAAPQTWGASAPFGCRLTSLSMTGEEDSLLLLEDSLVATFRYCCLKIRYLLFEVSPCLHASLSFLNNLLYPVLICFFFLP